jgi:hypothetical protein
MTNDNLTTIKRMAANLKDEGTESLKRWRQRMADEPLRALEWGDVAFEAAAKLKVGSVLEQMLGNDTTVEHILARVNELVLFSAMNREKSTGQCSNMLERCVLAVYANFLNEVRYSYLLKER